MSRGLAVQTRKTNTSFIFPKSAQSSAMVQVTEETHFWVKNVSLCESLRQSDKKKAGSPNICSLSASNHPTDKKIMSAPLSRPLAEKQILLCSFRPNRFRKKVGK